MAGKNVEEIKAESRGLRGTLAESLASAAPNFSEEEYQLLKFHGMYQQDDRDLRNERKKVGLDKAWSLMVRTKQPSGVTTPAQYLALDKLCEEIASGSLRLTTRQGIQFHGILKVDLKDCMKRIRDCGLTTWGACGDVVRNTMGPAAPLDTPAHRDATRLAEELTQKFYAKSSAYAEIWLDGEKLAPSQEPEEEPVYGKVYLPRKFKIGIAVPPVNDVDVFSQDLGFVCHSAGGVVEGYTVLVGGGFGMSHGQAHTRPFLGQPLCFVTPEKAVDAAVAVVTMQRDFGNRQDRKLSRLKYLVNSRGIEWVRDEVARRMGAPLVAPRPFTFDGVGDLLGWHDQGDGKWFCGVWVSEGRIKDGDSVKYRSGFRAAVERFGVPMRVTPNTNIIFHDIDPARKAEFEDLLKQHGIPMVAGMTAARLSSHACVSLPTCGLALAESERVFPKVMDGIDAVLRELGLAQEPILIRMSGCPNGCSRPYNADFAFVGRAPGKYALYIGGSHRGDRLAGLEKKTLAEEDIPATLRAVLQDFVKNRTAGERFSDYWGRTHVNGETPSSEQFHVELEERQKRLETEKGTPGAPAE